MSMYKKNKIVNMKKSDPKHNIIQKMQLPKINSKSKHYKSCIQKFSNDNNDYNEEIHEDLLGKIRNLDEIETKLMKNMKKKKVLSENLSEDQRKIEIFKNSMIHLQEKINFINNSQRIDINKVNYENSILIMKVISKFKREFMFEIFKSDSMVNSNQSEIWSLNGKVHSSKLTIGKNTKNDNNKNTLYMNFKSLHIFKLLNITLDEEAIKSYDTIKYSHLIQIRDKQETEIKENLNSLLYKIYNIKLDINTMTKETTEIFSKIETKKREFDIKLNFLNKKEQEARQYILNLTKSMNDNQQIANEGNVYINDINDINGLISIFNNKVNEILLEKESFYKENKIENDSLRQVLIVKQNNVEEKKQVKQELKNIFNQLIESYSTYLYNILKIGIDVRSEGLVWIVSSLLEMNCNIDYNMFPRYLKREHIDYVIVLGKYYVIFNQTKIIYQHLKRREKISKEELLKEKNTIINSNGEIKLNISNKDVIINAKKSIEKSLDDMITYYKTELIKVIKKNNYNDYIINEESQILKHKSIVEFNKNKHELKCIKEIYEDLIIKIKEMKITEMNRFKLEYDGIKDLNQNNKIEYDLMFCGLFGFNNTLY